MLAYPPGSPEHDEMIRQNEAQQAQIRALENGNYGSCANVDCPGKIVAKVEIHQWGDGPDGIVTDGGRINEDLRIINYHCPICQIVYNAPRD